MNFPWFDIFILILGKKPFADPICQIQMSLCGVQYSVHF